jgi:hypothetical protein
LGIVTQRLGIVTQCLGIVTQRSGSTISMLYILLIEGKTGG